jgi:hypothetical protein
MPVRQNLADNLPREFEICPSCGRKGFCHYQGNVIRGANGRVGGFPPGKRCKYCRHAEPEMSVEDYHAILRQTYGLKEV